MSNITNAAPTGKMQLGEAWGAVRKLIADPEDTAQVFNVIRAMSGPALQRGFARFSKLAVGRRVLDEQIDLVDTLRDRDKLRAMRGYFRAYQTIISPDSAADSGCATTAHHS